MRIIAILLVLMAVLVAGFVAFRRARLADMEERAQDFVNAMARGEFAYGVAFQSKADLQPQKRDRRYARNLAAMAGRREAVWRELTHELGAFQRIRASGPGPERNSVLVTCEFAMGNADVLVTFNRQGEVTGYGAAPGGRERPGLQQPLQAR